MGHDLSNIGTIPGDASQQKTYNMSAFIQQLQGDQLVLGKRCWNLGLWQVEFCLRNMT